jgi:hypothetical protein
VNPSNRAPPEQDDSIVDIQDEEASPREHGNNVPGANQFPPMNSLAELDQIQSRNQMMMGTLSQPNLNHLEEDSSPPRLPHSVSVAGLQHIPQVAVNQTRNVRQLTAQRTQITSSQQPHS